jgi:hypothetical protein
MNFIKRNLGAILLITFFLAGLAPIVVAKIRFLIEADSCKWGNQSVLQFYFLEFPYGTGVPENKVVYTPDKHTCIGYYKFVNADANSEIRVIADLFVRTDGSSRGEPRIINIWSNDMEQCKHFVGCVSEQEFERVLKNLY